MFSMLAMSTNALSKGLNVISHLNYLVILY